ncbi:MAG: hypothetical protein LUF68_07785, partial [Clostridiales bacterium]|nr:hypothetical protein [Clostridiales bacterium]
MTFFMLFLQFAAPLGKATVLKSGMFNQHDYSTSTAHMQSVKALKKRGILTKICFWGPAPMRVIAQRRPWGRKS